jgi:hypothetical protein
MAADIYRDATHTAVVLLEALPAPLSAWYGNPMTMEFAGQLLSHARIRQQERLRAGATGFQLQLLKALCHHWLGTGPDSGFAELKALAARGHERALLQLVRGQLLASRKASGALACLAAGFREAAPMLDTAEYFALVRQHELLAYLPYSNEPATAKILDELLAEAAVIKQLRSGQPNMPACLHQDTVG